jgi:hypothetical protein
MVNNKKLTAADEASERAQQAILRGAGNQWQFWITTVASFKPCLHLHPEYEMPWVGERIVVPLPNS